MFKGYIMPSNMCLDDEIRLKILETLLEKGVVQPSIKLIQRKTGFHKATITSSIEFLKKKGALEGFGPKLNFRSLGQKLDVIHLIQADLSEEKLFQRFLGEVEKDSNCYFLSRAIGSGNWNLLARHVYSDIESFHLGLEKKYFKKIEGLYKLIQNQQIFYFYEPFYKKESRTTAAVEILKKK